MTNHVGPDGMGTESTVTIDGEEYDITILEKEQRCTIFYDVEIETALNGSDEVRTTLNEACGDSASDKIMKYKASTCY